jgi:pyridoxal phosphate enzyme (YggS family)
VDISWIGSQVADLHLNFPDGSTFARAICRPARRRVSGERGGHVADAAKRLGEVRARIESAARRAGRDPATITLIAVSKTFEADAILPVLQAGHRVFGENRVQEAERKWPALRSEYPDLRLHLIGPLQTNKAREAVALFDAIHSLDRDKLAVALVKEISRQGRTPALFVQVNTGAEPQKAGIATEAAAEFVSRCRKEHGLAVEGLMCIPPLDDDPVPHFEMLRRLGDRLRLKSLSIGMSADFEAAILNGATHVRVGSAIFGERG